MNTGMNRELEPTARIPETQDALEKLNSALIVKCKQTDILFDKLNAVLRAVCKSTDDKNSCVPSMYSCQLPCAIEGITTKLTYDTIRIADLIDRLEV